MLRSQNTEKKEMYNLLKEVSIKEALSCYNDSIKVRILRPVKQSNGSIYYKIEDMSEFFEGCIFMVDDSEIPKSLEIKEEPTITAPINTESIVSILYPDSSEDSGFYLKPESNTSSIEKQEVIENSDSKTKKVKKSKNDKFDYGKLGALLDAGWKVSDIALEFKISKNTAYYHIRKYRDLKSKSGDLKDDK